LNAQRDLLLWTAFCLFWGALLGVITRLVQRRNQTQVIDTPGMPEGYVPPSASLNPPDSLSQAKRRAGSA
jgi:hypothetical protein